MNHMTFKQYRIIDLSIFAVLLIISEAAATLLTTTWLVAQPVIISTTLLFVCIVMMRWSRLSAIHACIGGAVLCIASNATLEQFVVYIVGNLFALLAMLLFKAFSKDGIRKGPFKLVLFTSSAYVFMQVGRWIMSLFFGGSLLGIVDFLTKDSLSLLFAVIVMLLLRNTDGVLEDQKSYLFRLQREREEEAKANVPDTYGYGIED